MVAVVKCMHYVLNLCLYRYKTWAGIFPLWWYNWSEGSASKWKILHTTTRSHWDIFLHVAIYTWSKIQRMGLAGCAGALSAIFRHADFNIDLTLLVGRQAGPTYCACKTYVH